MQFIDSHAHIDLTLTSTSLTLSELLKNELIYILNISLNPLGFSQQYLEYSIYPQIKFASGIYPSCITLENYNKKTYLAALKETLTSYPCIALGEAGIDFKYEKYGEKSAQMTLFEEQCALAIELELPIIVHSRNTFDECFSVLQNFPLLKSVFHCFSYGPKEAEILLNAGHYLSFTGNITYKNAKNIRDAALITPIDRIFFETDCPYLTPNTPSAIEKYRAHRSDTNLPQHVMAIYNFFAELKAQPLDDICTRIEQNFCEFFKITK